MSAPAKAHEPTMEEILASIRRIISDDDPAKSGPKSAAAPSSGEARLAPAPDDEAEGTPTVAGETQEARSEPMVEPRSEASRPGPAFDLADDLDVFELTEELATEEPRQISGPEPQRVAEPQPRAEAAHAGPDRLLSPVVDQAVSRAFGDLAHTVLAGNSRTIDDVVREMLRPMLRTWLDDNLPPLVERLVRQEIERVARGGR